ENIKDQTILQTQRYHYNFAIRCYRRSIKAFDRRLEAAHRDKSTKISPHNDINYLIKQRMAVTHQIGDSLRALERFSEAESYYRDIELLYPYHIRNITNISKNYCLAHNWEVAFEFLEHDVFIRLPEAAWNADISFYRAWCILGGI